MLDAPRKTSLQHLPKQAFLPAQVLPKSRQGTAFGDEAVA